MNTYDCKSSVNTYKTYPDAIKFLYDKGAHLVLCEPDKSCEVTGWNRTPATWQDIIRHTSYIGIIPSSMKCVGFDADYGDVTPLVHKFDAKAITYCKTPSGQEGRWHIYAKFEGSFGNGKWKHRDCGGDIRCDRGYLVLHRPDLLSDVQSWCQGNRTITYKEIESLANNTKPVPKASENAPKSTKKVQEILSQPIPAKGMRYPTLVENAGYLAKVSPSHLEDLRTLGLSWHDGPAEDAKHIHALIDTAKNEWAPRDHDPNYNKRVKLDNSGKYYIELDNLKLTGFQQWCEHDELSLYQCQFDGKTYIKWKGMDYVELDDLLLCELIKRIHAQAKIEVKGKDGAPYLAKAEFSKGRLADTYCGTETIKRDMAQEHLEAIPAWEPENEDPIIDRFLIDKYGVKDTPLMRWASRFLWMGQVQRIMEPGCDLHEVPVLKGPQGIGKSSLCKAIAVKPTWFAETHFGSNGDKALAEIFAGKCLLELTEWSTRNQRSVERTKAFISISSDRYRRPYDKFAKDHPRHCIFVGTTNETHILPDDSSGNRRYVVVDLCKTYEPWKEWTYEQNQRALAEARYWLYESEWPKRANLDNRLKAELELQFERYRDYDPLRDKVDCLDRAEGITSDILYELMGWSNNPNNAERRRLRDNMEELGWSLKVRKHGGKTKRFWATNEFAGTLALPPDDSNDRKF